LKPCHHHGRRNSSKSHQDLRKFDTNLWMLQQILKLQYQVPSCRIVKRGHYRLQLSKMKRVKQRLSSFSTSSILNLQKLSLDGNDDSQSYLPFSSKCVIIGQSSPTSVIDRTVSVEEFPGSFSSRTLPHVPQTQSISTMDDEDFEMELVEACTRVLPQVLRITNQHSRLACHRPSDPVAEFFLSQC
jgi:hypothetical protein